MYPVWAFKLLKKSSSTLSRPGSITYFSNYKKTNALAHWLLTCPGSVGEVHLSDKPVPPWARIPKVCRLRVDHLSLAIWIWDLRGDRSEKKRQKSCELLTELLVTSAVNPKTGGKEDTILHTKLLLEGRTTLSKSLYPPPQYKAVCDKCFLKSWWMSDRNKVPLLSTWIG